MAKGKTFTYILIACVAAVWGLIVYRVFAAMSSDDEVLPMGAAVKVPYFKMVDHQYDKVALVLGDRDPFRPAPGYENGEEENASPRETSIKTVMQQPLKPIVQKPQVNWSSIQYTGYINNPDSKQKMALVMVNTNSAVLKEGQSAHGLKLLKNLRDSLQVQYQGETKFIKLK